MSIDWFDWGISGTRKKAHTHKVSDLKISAIDDKESLLLLLLIMECPYVNFHPIVVTMLPIVIRCMQRCIWKSFCLLPIRLSTSIWLPIKIRWDFWMYLFMLLRCYVCKSDLTFNALPFHLLTYLKHSYQISFGWNYHISTYMCTYNKYIYNA